MPCQSQERRKERETVLGISVESGERDRRIQVRRRGRENPAACENTVVSGVGCLVVPMSSLTNPED